MNDSVGGADRTYQYDDWGKLSGGTDGGGFAGADKLRWKGALWYGNEAKFYYMRNRWYDPETGRFWSEDPLGVDAGTNLYAFADNDPANGGDPSGLGPYQLDELNTTVLGGFRGIPPWLIDTWYRNNVGSGPIGEYLPSRVGGGLAGSRRSNACREAAILFAGSFLLDAIAIGPLIRAGGVALRWGFGAERALGRYWTTSFVKNRATAAGARQTIGEIFAGRATMVTAGLYGVRDATSGGRFAPVTNILSAFLIVGTFLSGYEAYQACK